MAARCKRPDGAFELLRQAILIGDPNAVILPVDASFASLHGDARWPLLLAAVRKPRRR